MNDQDTGAASLHISLSKGVIEVSHGHDCSLLASGPIKKGDWDRLISFLKNDLGLEWKEEITDLGNTKAREGYDRCPCGCKYWEQDRCIDCNTHINDIAQEDE